MTKHVLCTALFAILAAGSTAQAQQASFGLQAHLALPTGEAGDWQHLDGAMGYGIGIQVPIDFGGGHVLRPKLDYLTFSRNSNGIDTKASTFAVLADYNYYFAGRREGIYLIAGLGFNSTDREVTNYNFGHHDDTSTGFAYNAGVGYAFNKKVAVEVKFFGAALSDWRVNNFPMDDSYTANAAVASVSYIF